MTNEENRKRLHSQSMGNQLAGAAFLQLIDHGGRIISVAQKLELGC